MRDLSNHSNHFRRLSVERQEVLQAIDFEIAERDRLAARFGFSAWVSGGAIAVMLWHGVEVLYAPGSVNWEFVLAILTTALLSVSVFFSLPLLWASDRGEPVDLSRFERVSDRQRKIAPVVLFDLVCLGTLCVANVSAALAFSSVLYGAAALWFAFGLVVVSKDHRKKTKSKHFAHFGDLGVRRPAGRLWWVLVLSWLYRIGLIVCLVVHAISIRGGEADVKILMIVGGVAIVSFVMCLLHVRSDAREALVDQRRDLLIGDPIVDPRQAIREVVFGLSITDVEANVFSEVNASGLRLSKAISTLDERADALGRAFPKCPSVGEAGHDMARFAAEEVDRLLLSVHVSIAGMRGAIQHAVRELNRVQQTQADAEYFRESIRQHEQWLQQKEQQISQFSSAFARWRDGSRGT